MARPASPVRLQAPHSTHATVHTRARARANPGAVKGPRLRHCTHCARAQDAAAAGEDGGEAEAMDTGEEEAPAAAPARRRRRRVPLSVYRGLGVRVAPSRAARPAAAAAAPWGCADETVALRRAGAVGASFAHVLNEDEEAHVRQSQRQEDASQELLDSFADDVAAAPRRQTGHDMMEAADAAAAAADEEGESDFEDGGGDA
jgi:hypothetical protein